MIGKSGGVFVKKAARLRGVASLLAVAAFGLAFPGAASAASDDSRSSEKIASFSDKCATGWVASKYEGLKIRSEAKNNATVLEAVGLGVVMRCSKHVYVNGEHYDGCGVYDASAWIIVATSDGDVGYSAMTCWVDFVGFTVPKGNNGG